MTEQQQSGSVSRAPTSNPASGLPILAAPLLGRPDDCDLYRRAFDRAPIGMALVSDDGRYLSVNAALCRFFDRSEDELLTLSWQDVTHPDDLALTQEKAAQMRAGEVVQVDIRKRYLRPDGSVVWGDLAVCDFGDGRSAAASIAQITDVTSEVNAELALLAAKREFQHLAEHAADVVLHATDEGIIAWVSTSVTKALGWLPEQLVGKRTEDFVHSDDVAAASTAASRLADGSEVRARVRLRRPQPEYRWHEQVVRPILSESGEVQSLVVTWRDIDEQVRLEAERRDVEHRYRLLAENSSDVVYLRDLDGRIAWISPSVETVLGFPVDQVLGIDPIVFVEGVMRSDVEEFRASLPRDGTPTTYLSQIRDASGDVRHMSSATRAVLDEQGDPIGFVVAMRDVGDLIAAQERLEADRAQLRAIMDSMLDPMVVLAPVRDSQGNVHDYRHIAANPAAARHTSRTVAQLVGRTLREVVPGQAESGLFELYTRVIETGEPMILDAFPYADEQQGGIPRNFDMRGVKVGDAICVTFRDVTERQEAAAALAASEALFRAAMESAPIGMAVTDLGGRFELCNAALERMLQRPAPWFADHRVADTLLAEDESSVHRAAKELLSGELESFVGPVRLRRADGSVATTRTAVVLLAGEPRHFLLQVADLTSEIEAREELAYRALHDRLTGLRNREWIMDVLELDLQAAARTKERVGVYFIDLDNFKLINDSLGHAAGDEVLQVVAERISKVLPTGAQVARFGGDEFIVILPGTGSTTEVERFAEQLCEAISMPMSVHGHPILPTASVGVAVSMPDSTAESLLRDTDAAVNRAKASGRARWHFFDEAMHAQALRRLTLEGELRRGLRDQEFVAHYQPIVALADGTIVGHEALVRWVHPERGLLAPGEFLAVAEESGLIVPIGWQVLEQACQVLADNPRLTGPISVNFSGGQLSARNWLDNVMAVLGNIGVDPKRLVLEVTETAVLSLRDSTRRDLARLRDLGIGIHVDDFGTGYSSISLLRDLPVTGLKLDGSFVADLTARPSSANALAAGLAGLANGLNLQRIAEGVETWQQAALLAGQGWTYGQGYLFARPGPTVRSGVIEPSPAAASSIPQSRTTD